MKQTENDRRIQQLKRDWENLDNLNTSSSISTSEIKQQLVQYKALQKKRLYKEVMIFLITAICILSAFAISMLQAPILFVIIQIAALVIGPALCFMLSRKSNHEGDAIV
ncbi:MAG: YxlC family protein [Bacillaceae bacterium]|nr:YxlC family protein [Bacillaceae bacterium]